MYALLYTVCIKWRHTLLGVISMSDYRFLLENLKIFSGPYFSIIFDLSSSPFWPAFSTQPKPAELAEYIRAHVRFTKTLSALGLAQGEGVCNS